MTYDRDSGHKSFLEDVFENESRLPGGSWGPSSVPWTDVVSIELHCNQFRFLQHSSFNRLTAYGFH